MKTYTDAYIELSKFCKVVHENMEVNNVNVWVSDHDDNYIIDGAEFECPIMASKAATAAMYARGANFVHLSFITDMGMFDWATSFEME